MSIVHRICGEPFEKVNTRAITHQPNNSSKTWLFIASLIGALGADVGARV